VTNEDIIYKHRLQIFQDYDSGQYTVSSLCRRYGYSRTWFYKFKERCSGLGDEGLRVMIRKDPKMPNQTPIDIEYKVLDSC
jgi:transposase-like protein